MGIGAITRYIDVPQVVLYTFWIFFFGLIYYLRREDKREGYPLESERSASISVQGFPAVPPRKVFKLRNGATYEAPPGTPETRELRLGPSASWLGAPQQPSGNPMVDAVGPASYAERENVPDLTAEGEAKVVPLRVAKDFSVAPRDPDPRGMTVIAADEKVAGIVRDVWIDRTEPQIRYLEVALTPAAGGIAVLLPIAYSRINARRRQVKVVSILAGQFAQVPRLALPESVTLREEDRITAYYGGGHLYAEPSRLGPIV
jgi:photosynthetic reaction center H subunit